MMEKRLAHRDGEVLELISQQLVRDGVVEAACRTLQRICEQDDTAIAEIEKALTLLK